MSGIHKDRINEFVGKIGQIDAQFGPLPGIATVQRRHCWAQQIVSSLRRISYTDTLLMRGVTARPVVIANCWASVSVMLPFGVVITRFTKRVMVVWLVIEAG